MQSHSKYAEATRLVIPYSKGSCCRLSSICGVVGCHCDLSIHGTVKDDLCPYCTSKRLESVFTLISSDDDAVLMIRR